MGHNISHHLILNQRGVPPTTPQSDMYETKTTFDYTQDWNPAFRYNIRKQLCILLNVQLFVFVFEVGNTISSAIETADSFYETPRCLVFLSRDETSVANCKALPLSQ
jgi:hypothetical protein